MADSRHITRRLLLKASPALALVGSAVFATDAIAAEEPGTKVRRLQRELSDALAELMTSSVAPADYVSIVYPAGTVEYARSLIDRDIFESGRERETLRGRAIDQWRVADDALKDALKSFDRTRWEFANHSENEARNAMLRTFRSL
ncbi:hypothetical protein [Paradevosia shaoguanensis]|uniref:hypothetical protein n=1 Tax=Paradevosia shaoguanensis TaxID=1335043 RepID=UPI001934B115|nr:hypothetical protein [Paradevosia shaoguanensis]